GFAIAAAVGIYQSCQVDPQLPVWDRPRAHAFVHPVTFGCQMTIAVIGASCFLVRPPRIWRGPRGRAAAMGLLAVCGTALFFSNTRGALFACFLALAATALLLPRPRKMLMLALAVGLALFFAGELARPDRSLIAEFAGWKTPLLIHGTQKMRLLLWDVALRIGIDHPLTGVGHNNFRTVFENYHNGLLEGYAKNWGTAHNLYLHHFAERGLLGLTALLVFLGAFWLRALRRVRQAAEPWNLWAFGTATAFLFMNMTEVALQVEILWMLVFFVWIWAEVLHRRRPHAAPAP
ncbi:MAG: O-antigen ligase family protein, partial [Elusimicrobiota bacterium]